MKSLFVLVVDLSDDQYVICGIIRFNDLKKFRFEKKLRITNKKWGKKLIIYFESLRKLQAYKKCLTKIYFQYIKIKSQTCRSNVKINNIRISSLKSTLLLTKLDSNMFIYLSSSFCF